MPYREPAPPPPPPPPKVIEHGPFRIAWIRLAIVALLTLPIVSALWEIFAPAVDDRCNNMDIGICPSVFGYVMAIYLLVVCLPLALILLISGVRGGGGTVRLTVHGAQLTVQRRWRLFGGRVRRFAVGKIRRVDVDRRGRRARLIMIMKNGREIDLADRRFLAVSADAHDRAADALRIALGCREMPEERRARRSSYYKRITRL